MHLRGIGYALTASLMFGLGVVLAKFLSGAVDAALVAFLSLAFGGLLLSGCLLFTGNPLFATLFALLLLHDTITPVQAIGGFPAVLRGIVVLLSDRKPIGKKKII
jgi:drug/metabolite transporter (DMT)-like permease